MPLPRIRFRFKHLCILVALAAVFMALVRWDPDTARIFVIMALVQWPPALWRLWIKKKLREANGREPTPEEWNAAYTPIMIRWFAFLVLLIAVVFIIAMMRR